MAQQEGYCKFLNAEETKKGGAAAQTGGHFISSRQHLSTPPVGTADQGLYFWLFLSAPSPERWRDEESFLKAVQK